MSIPLPIGYTRVCAINLPQRRVLCSRQPCVYLEKGTCGNLRIYRGNSDAACHRETPRQVLSHLDYRDGRTEQ